MTAIPSLTRRSGLALAAVAAAVALVVRLGVDHKMEPRPPAPVVDQNVVRAAELTPAQLRAFSVLRAPSQTPPGTTRAAIEKATRGTPLQGVNVNRAHRVTTAVGIDAWVLPGDGMLCVARDMTGTIACDSTPNAIARGIALEEQQPSGQWLLLGLAPDRARTVTVTPDKGPPEVLPVRGNVYSRLGDQPTGVGRIQESNGKPSR